MFGCDTATDNLRLRRDLLVLWEIVLVLVLRASAQASSEWHPPILFGIPTMVVMLRAAEYELHVFEIFAAEPAPFFQGILQIGLSLP